MLILGRRCSSHLKLMFNSSTYVFAVNPQKMAMRMIIAMIMAMIMNSNSNRLVVVSPPVSET